MERKNLVKGSASMRPRARLIGLIGEEIISDEPVALVELVKNAYDQVLKGGLRRARHPRKQLRDPVGCS